MRIEKSFEISASQEEVWRFVSTPEMVGMCFPGCQGVTALGEDKYKATIKVHFGPIKTVFNVDFEATETRPTEFLSYTSRGEEGNRASRLKADSTLTLSTLNEGRTRVVYTSDVSIVGRLGKFGLGMMNKKADSMGDEFVQVLRTKIEGPSDHDVDVPATIEKNGHDGWQKFIMVAIAVTITIVVFYFLQVDV